MLLALFSFYFVIISVIGFNIDINDTVKLHGFPDVGSYFGYSVGIAKSKSSGEIWILVGAPRSKDPMMPNVPRPGAVFACTAPKQGSSNCSKLDIDPKTGDDSVPLFGKNVMFRHGKNDSWLGGSIGIPTSGSSVMFATCAYKWYNTLFMETDNRIFMQGICYVIPLDFSMNNVKKLPVMTNDSMIMKYMSGAAKYVVYYGQAGVGMSVHYTKNEDHLLLGTPGLLDWIGGFVDIGNAGPKVMENSINNTDIIRPYIGYSTSSGSYFSDTHIYFVTGAPREEMRGKVLFFRSSDATYSLQNATKSLEGRINDQNLPVNSYYGAALCTLDINNDKVDDLFVGAPLYSPLTDNVFTENIEIGIVFVYLGSKSAMNFQPEPQLLQGTHLNGRFGSAITNLGDINADSFADVAIGAPYEDDMKGAVYIYNGYRVGVWPTYSQRILASAIDIGLRGFGISIASAKDVNSDGVNDLVIGSYLSDEAVVLFGQPVINVSAQMNVINSGGKITNFIQIAENETQNIIVCLRFVDRRCSFIRFKITISLDIENADDEKRIVFTENNEATIIERLHTQSSDLKCTTRHYLKTKSTSDLVTDIVVQAVYEPEVISCSGLPVRATVSRFDGNSPGEPVLKLRNRLQFKNDCPNNECKTDLILEAKALYENVDGFFVIGNQDLTLNINITKKGDASYCSIFYLVYPDYLSYNNMEKILGDTDISCVLIDKSNNDTTIQADDEEAAMSCLFGNPMKNDNGVVFRLFMNVPLSVHNDDVSMYLRMYVETLSDELVPGDNIQVIKINLRHNLKTSFSAVSKTGDIYLEDRKETYDMENVYDIHNKGPSLMQMATITISVPQIQESGKALLYLNRTEAQCGYTCSAECILRSGQVTPVVYSFVKGRLVNKTESPSDPLPSFKNDDCRHQKCSRFQCTFSNIQAQTSAVVYMNFVVLKDIENVFNEPKGITLYSTATVQINKTNLISNQTEFGQQLSISVRKRVMKKEELPWWVILVSVLGGVLLIALLILILWKVGFFKRKKRDELEKRKSHAPETSNKVSNEKKRDSYTDSEGGIVDNEVPPGSNDKGKI